MNKLSNFDVIAKLGISSHQLTIGVGSYSTVYKVKRTDDDTLYALKVVCITPQYIG